MALLLQTLFCTGGRVRQTLTGNSPTELAVNTPAGTHDGSPSTSDAASDTSPCNINYSVRYQIDTYTTIGTISFVRVVLKNHRIQANTGTINPTIGAVDQGTPQSLNIGDTIINFDFAVDPATGLPWTTSSINAYNGAGGWGFRFLVADASNPCTVVDTEIYVEVWGAQGIPPGIVTTYSTNSVNAGSAGISFSSLATPDRDGRWKPDEKLAPTPPEPVRVFRYGGMQK